MIWQDSIDPNELHVPDDIQDLSFRIEAKTLPLDHATALSDEILDKLPWLTETKHAGIHLINYPESGNGWERAKDNPKEIFFASKRLRLRLRLPKECIEDATALCGEILNVDGHSVKLGKSNPLLLSKSSTLSARKVIILPNEDEQKFLDRIIDELKDIGIVARKILCGVENKLSRHGGILSVRSVMLADLEIQESIQLQQLGLGKGRLFGCGIFTPHKGISSTRPED